MCSLEGVPSVSWRFPILIEGSPDQFFLTGQAGHVPKTRHFRFLKCELVGCSAGWLFIYVVEIEFLGCG